MRLERQSGSTRRGALPLFYLAFAHLALAVCFLFLGHAPRTFVGFFYHPQMMAPVHLVTLGWVTATILGALYMVAPMALRTRLEEGRVDHWAFWSFAIGVAGMVAHFWIESYSGMLWSVPLVIFGLAVVAARVARALHGAPIALGVKLHLLFAFANLLGAATVGFLVGLGRFVPVLPGYVLSQVSAHAHLAVLGWGTMMVFGIGYRLLPMLLPAAVPAGVGPVLAALLLEAGVVGLVLGLLLRSSWLGLFALLSAAGVAAFFAHLVWMLRHRRAPPPERLRPDFGLAHVTLALVYLILATLLGLALALFPLEATARLRLATLYGLFALLGFLAQMVLGVGDRLLPLYAWFRASAESDSPLPAPHRFPDPRLHLSVLVAWTVGVPLLGAGLYGESPMLVGVAAWLLLLAVLLQAASGLLVLGRHPHGPR